MTFISNIGSKGAASICAIDSQISIKNCSFFYENGNNPGILDLVTSPSSSNIIDNIVIQSTIKTTFLIRFFIFFKKIKFSQKKYLKSLF